jgi:hypothetical protein
MRATRIALPTAIVVLGLSAWACSKTESTAPTGALTQSQVSQLFSELRAVSASFSSVGFDRAGIASLGSGLAVVTNPAFDVLSSINATGNCPVGGTVSISGSVTPATSSVSFGFTDTWNNCQTADFLTNGSTTESGTFNYTTGSSPTVSGSLTDVGNLTVTPNSGSPISCSMNITLTLSGPTSSPNLTWSGTICGVNVNGTL